MGTKKEVAERVGKLSERHYRVRGQPPRTPEEAGCRGPILVPRGSPGHDPRSLVRLAAALLKGSHLWLELSHQGGTPVPILQRREPKLRGGKGGRGEEEREKAGEREGDRERGEKEGEGKP